MVNFTRNNTSTDHSISLSLAVHIPVGTTASLCMPMFWADATKVVLTLDGVPQTQNVRAALGGAYACVDHVQPVDGHHSRLSLQRWCPGASTTHACAVATFQAAAATPAFGHRRSGSQSLGSARAPTSPRNSRWRSQGPSWASACSRANRSIARSRGLPTTRSFQPARPAASARSCPKNEGVECDHCKNHPANVNVSLLAAKAREMAAKDEIDDVAHLRATRAYTFCGTNDQDHFGATVAARDFYAQFADSTTNVLFNFTVPSGHCWPQDGGFAVPCGAKSKIVSAWPLQDCHYDGPGAMLQHFYGPLQPPSHEMAPHALHLFDQAPFDGNNTSGGRGEVGLGSAGLVYVPTSCASGTRKCALHVFMHGCHNPFVMEYPEARSLSTNRWAETNGIVVLWPHREPRVVLLRAARLLGWLRRDRDGLRHAERHPDECDPADDRGGLGSGDVSREAPRVGFGTEGLDKYIIIF